MDSIALKEYLNRSRATQDHERITRLKSTQNQLKPKITKIFKHLDEIIKLDNSNKLDVDKNLKNIYLAILEYKINKKDSKINIAEDEDLQAFDRWMDDLIHQGSTISDNDTIKQISLKASRFISTETSDNCVTNPVTEEAPENIEKISNQTRITRQMLDAIFNDDDDDDNSPYTVKEFTSETKYILDNFERDKDELPILLEDLNKRGLELPEQDESRILPIIIKIMTGDQKELHKKFKAFYNLSSEPGEEQNQAYLELIRYVNAEKVHDYENFTGLFIKVFQPIVSRLITKEKYEDSIKSWVL